MSDIVERSIRRRSGYYWVGLENQHYAPNGHGEDCREYVEIEGTNDEIAAALRAAVLRITHTLTNLGDGDRIAIHALEEEK